MGACTNCVDILAAVIIGPAAIGDTLLLQALTDQFLFDLMQMGFFLRPSP